MKNFIRWAAMLFAVAAVMSACSSGSSKNDDDEPGGGGNESSKGYAPKSINGKTFKSATIYNSFKFTSNSFTVKYSFADDYSTLGTPSYSYVRTGDNTATLKMVYKNKFNLNYDWVESNYTYNSTLTFTSATGGVLSGKEICDMKSNVFPNKKETRNYSGAFTLN